ncbi:MAG: ABC transporter substrate-binding protein [Oleiphilaceae bacterium]|nr:ABC transporter substrate-binding protein [Oleiphilaceae bacterium]
MKKWLIRLMLVACLPCQTHAIDVYFVNPGYDKSGFWFNVSQTMLAAAKQLNFTVHINYANREWPQMRENAQAMIAAAKAGDYLILVNEHQQAADLLKQANDKELKVLMLLNTLTQEQENAIGRPILTVKNWIGSLTPDNRQAGREMAQALFNKAQQLKPDASTYKLLTLIGDHSTPASIERTQGLDDMLAQSPQVSEARRFTVNWSYEQAYSKVDTWLSVGGAMDLVWAANDPIAFGAIDAANTHGLIAGKDFLVVGLNWSADALKKVEQRAMVLTHGGHFLAGAWSMVLIHDHHAGMGLPAEAPHFRFPMAAITAEAPEALKQLIHTRNWSALDYRRFTKSGQTAAANDYDFGLNAIIRATVQ